MYNIGDKIVYTVHGAGTIVDIQEIDLMGNVEKYYILQLPINDMKVSVPITDHEGIRPVIDPDVGREVLEALKVGMTEMSQNWGQRFRDNLELIKTGNIFDLASTVRNLTLLDKKKGLSASEKKMLNNAKRIMASELVIIGVLSKEQVIKLIDEAIL